MPNKISINSILLKHLKPINYACIEHDLKAIPLIKAAFKEALEAAIDKCADNADVSWAGTPDRQSILNVKKMINYD